MSYVINVGRMHLVNKWLFIGVPLLIMASATAVVIVIGAVLIPGDTPFVTGAGQAPLWYFLIAGIQALTLTFPFSQGLSITRRNFFLGTTVTFLMVSLCFAVLFFLLGLLEDATRGWWVGGYIFALPWLTDAPWYQTVLLVWAATFMLFTVGFWIATIYKRWGTTGVLAASLSVVVLLLAVAGMFTFTSSWPAVGGWFARQTPLTAAGWVLLLIAAMQAGSLLTLRRATP